MRTLLLALLCSLLCFGGTAFAHDVLVIQGTRVKPFDDALRGFRTVCRADSKTVVLSEAEGIDVLRTVREERPQLIVAIGADALSRVKRVRDIPILYLMVLNPEKTVSGAKNVTGVNMTIPPGKYLALLEKLRLPNLRVGILYDPVRSGAMVRRIQHAAQAAGIEISAREVHNPKDVPEALAKMKDSVNVFWMLPDPTVVTPETVEFLLLFSQQNNVPVVTFARKYVDMGALVSLDIDSSDLGKQAGAMANELLNGADVAQFPKADARKAVMKINRKVARKFGLSLADSGPPGSSDAE